MRGPYDDIIDLPHHVSKRHPQMPADERAAQFSPFAALTGYGAVIRETARLTDRKIDLSENMKEELERKLKELCAQNCEGEITFFVPDGRKEGGAYVTAEGRVKKTDDAERAVVLEDGTRIPVEDIVDIRKKCKFDGSPPVHSGMCWLRMAEQG